MALPDDACFHLISPFLLPCFPRCPALARPRSSAIHPETNRRKHPSARPPRLSPSLPTRCFLPPLPPNETRGVARERLRIASNLTLSSASVWYAQGGVAQKFHVLDGFQTKFSFEGSHLLFRFCFLRLPTRSTFAAQTHAV